MKKKKKCDNIFCLNNSSNKKVHPVYTSGCSLESISIRIEDFSIEECPAYKRYKKCGW